MEIQDLLLNSAYVALLVSLVVRGPIQFRIIMTVACVFFIGFARIVDNSWMQFWNLLFAGINIFQGARVLYDKRPGRELQAESHAQA